MVDYSSFICNRQKLETTKISPNRPMVKETVVNPYEVYHSAVKKNKTKKQPTDTATIWMDLK